MPRAIWTGAITFGLVNVPVRAEDVEEEEQPVDLLEALRASIEASKGGRRRRPRRAAASKESLIGRHLTFVPLGGVTLGPDHLQVAVSAAAVKAAPNIEMHGDELSQADES